MDCGERDFNLRFTHYDFGLKRFVEVMFFPRNTQKARHFRSDVSWEQNSTTNMNKQYTSCTMRDAAFYYSLGTS
jgi:hypothetical protein